MKKLLSILAMLAIVFTASADTYSRDVNVLPQKAKTVLAKNFSSQVSVIKLDHKHNHVSEYEVILNDGSEITFDSKGNWKEVEVNKASSVPSVFVLSEISKYVSQNYRDARIVGVEKDRKGYEVQLSIGQDLKFDRQGRFLRLDN